MLMFHRTCFRFFFFLHLSFVEKFLRFGVLQSLEEVIPHMAPKLMMTTWPVRLMQLVASILERAGKITMMMERQEQMHITRCPGPVVSLVGW